MAQAHPTLPTTAPTARTLAHQGRSVELVFHSGEEKALRGIVNLAEAVGRPREPEALRQSA